MKPDPRSLVRNLEMLARASAEAAAFLGAAVLVGWALNLPLLRSGVPGAVTTKPNTAVCFVLAGLAGRLLASRRTGARGRWLAKLAGATVALVGLLTLVEYLTGANLQVDAILLREVPGAAGPVHSGRMAPNSALAFVLLGLGLALSDVETARGSRPSQLLALAAGLVPLQAVIGYAYGVEPLRGFAAYTRVSFYGGIGFALLVAAVLFARPESGLMRVFTGPGLAGFMARRLTIAVLVIPVALGWIFLVAGLRAGQYEALLGASFVVISAVVVAAAVVYWNAQALAELEAERLRAEDTERQQREWLRTTLASIGDAVVATDVVGTVTLLNAVAEKLTGAGQGAVGRRLEEVFRAVDEETGEPIDDPTARALREGGLVVLPPRTKLVAPSGAEYPVGGSAAPIRGEGGEVLGVALVFSDMTERRRHEAERAALFVRERDARAEAERASRAKDEFIATVSHELRTPLNAVLGWARLLRGGRLDAAATARAIEAIERSAITQAQIVDDLLDVSRIVRGQMKLDVREADLAAAVEAAADTVRPAATAKSIALSLDLEPGAGSVRGDPARLQQVVWNLLANAIKFTPPGGRVEVRLVRLVDRVRLVVKDTGAGIEASFLPHVFERFRQADSSPTRTHGGLGLGLAIVRHLVEAHGGAVAAESEGKGRGASFTVDLPLPQPGPALAGDRPERSGSRAPAAPAPAVSLSELRVLVVDDDPDTLEALRQLLEQAGAGVVAAASAGEAMAALQRAAPDVILSDIGMPGEDGISLIRRVRSLEAGRSIPAAALTAYTQAEDRDRALGAGYQVFLAKPVDPGVLTAALARLAGRA
ncbi:MAG TPA: ATP-binding protein [Anaeromyxobacteraceae bacterium]|nr:ATP-binding protein [Anaeromyxobacteraceae bacterium]